MGIDVKIKFLEKGERNSFWKYYIEIWQDGYFVESDLWRDWSNALKHIELAAKFFK
jgi:hypothetical protein